MQKAWYKIRLHKFFLFTFAPPPAVLVFCPGKPSSSSFPSLLFKDQASLPRLSLTPKLINHKLIATLKSWSWKWLPWPFKWDFIEALRRLCLREDQRTRDCCREHPRAVRPHSPLDCRLKDAMSCLYVTTEKTWHGEVCKEKRLSHQEQEPQLRNSGTAGSTRPPWISTSGHFILV